MSVMRKDKQDQQDAQSHPLGRRLRVCHLGKFYHPAQGGMETHVRTLAQAQAALGAEVRVVCVNHQDRRGRDVTWSRFAATATEEDWDGSVGLTRVGRLASLARFEICLGLTRMLRQRQCDVFHLHVPNPTMLLALALSRPAAPLVVTYHSDVVKQKKLGLVLRPFEHLVFGRAAGVIATSPAYAEGSDLLRAYRSKVCVLPFGVNLRPFLNPGPAVLRRAEVLKSQYGRPLWLAVGRLVYYKGLHNAIRALASVPGRLLVVGNGPLEPDLRRLAEEVGVADRVIWRGRLSEQELTAAYHAATALWLPSNARSEAFGLVQVEAMASGCPVINTAIPASGVSWVSRHEESGLTVPIDDPAALAGAARRLLSEPGLRDRLGRQARKRARLEFADDLMGRRSLDLYQKVRAVRPDPGAGRIREAAIQPA
jgi:glycosyltransferase involved in cell wall biosynthesis